MTTYNELCGCGVFINGSSGVKIEPTSNGHDGHNYYNDLRIFYKINFLHSLVVI